MPFDCPDVRKAAGVRTDYLQQRNLLYFLLVSSKGGTVGEDFHYFSAWMDKQVKVQTYIHTCVYAYSCAFAQTYIRTYSVSTRL